MEDNTQILSSGEPDDNDKTRIIRMDSRPEDNQKEPVVDKSIPHTESASSQDTPSSSHKKQNTMSNEDKTIFQSGSGTGGRESDIPRSSVPNPSIPTDHTQVDSKTTMGPDPRVVQASTGQPNVQAPSASAKTEELKASLNKQEKSGGVSTGAAIGAAAAAGAAGVAFGTAYSDKIKDAFSGIGASATEGSDPVANTPEPTTGDEGGTTDGSTTADPISTSGGTSPASGADSGYINVSYSDPSGNAYGIYVSDMDNDGKLDFAEADITAVDGSNIHITASGDGFMNMLQDQISMASPGDYIEQGGYIIPTGLVEQSPLHQLYDIAPGDTLSDIAAAHNTSIVNILDLNPSITDPDMIISGEQLIIPTGDNISDPYAGYTEYLDGVTDIVQPDDIMLFEEEDGMDVGITAGVDLPEMNGLVEEMVDVPSEEDLGLGENPDQFEEVDWASFNESPILEESGSGELPDYNELMSNTDFDAYNSETFQISENTDLLSDSTDVASEFL
jgi:LysM repeat protein